MQKWYSLFIGLVLFTGSYAQETPVYDSLNADLMAIKAKCVIDKKDETVLKLFEQLYDEALQSDEANLSEAALNAYTRLISDSTTPNWQILYLFQHYQMLVTDPNVDPDLQLGTVKLLCGEALETYDQIPAMILIYMGEALNATNHPDLAAKHFKDSLHFYPDPFRSRFIIAFRCPKELKSRN